jgi:hypothetical protein
MAGKPKKKEPPKSPHEMTSDEAMAHLFHPKVVKAIKDHLREQEAGVERGSIKDQ